MPSLTDIPTYFRGPANHYQFVRWLGRQILPAHTKRELAALWKRDANHQLTREDWTIILDKHTTFHGTSS